VFQKNIKESFLRAEDEAVTKRSLSFIEKIVVRFLKVEMFGKFEGVLAVLQNKKAVSTGGVLTAMDYWLPGTDSNCRPSG
jgi:hypothetical protein